MTDTGVSLTPSSAARVGRATDRVERTTRERHNVTRDTAFPRPIFTPTVVLVAEVTGPKSLGSGLHPARLHQADSTAAPIEWQAVTGDYHVLPMPGQTLAEGAKGVALLVGVHEGAPVYSLGGPASGICRETLAKLLPTSRVTFAVQEGHGWCAEIAAKSIAGWRPDPDVEKWYSLGTFPTKLGDTSLTYLFDDNTGAPVVLLTATTGEGSGATTVIKPLTYIGCADGCPEFEARPLLWCDSRPVTDCDQCPGGAPRRYRTTLAGGTGGYAVLNGEHTFEHDAGCAWLLTTPGFIGSAQWVDQGGGERQLQTQIGHVASSAFVSWSGPFVSTSADCCAAVAGTEYADFDPGSGGAGDTPALPTVAAVGPCVSERCGDNTFRVRVCCKAHTKYTGCDALPDYSGAWCITGTSGYTGAESGGELSGNYGPDFYIGPGLFRDTGLPVNNPPDDEHDDRCGFDLWNKTDPVLIAAFNAVGLYSSDLERAIVYYEPDAEDGAGAWVLAVLYYDGFSGFTITTIAAAANDPDPTDDPFEIVFRWVAVGDLYHELRITPGPCGDEEDEGGEDGPLDAICCAGEGEALAGDPPPSIRVTVADGPNAGPHDLPFNPTTGGWDDGEDPVRWNASCGEVVVEGVPTMQWACTLDGIGPAMTSAACSPFGVVFPGDNYGSTLPVTLSVSP
ncbi:MAG TPA: hypothetical protein VD866_16980 [Urbifossiella sp.]|nr:hypothetical protein [Urbifossiella sp.]